ncbi:MAG: hypothetical protein JRE63_06100 [Deltaproteobacteria bacterium]|jgi:hypothetical protein|nr:hypothetical protein [Deltaproteobacteria bacterium]
MLRLTRSRYVYLEKHVHSSHCFLGWTGRPWLIFRLLPVVEGKCFVCCLLSAALMGDDLR